MEGLSELSGFALERAGGGEGRAWWVLNGLGSLRSGRGGYLWLRGEEHDKAGSDVELSGEAEKKENRGWFWNQRAKPDASERDGLSAAPCPQLGQTGRVSVFLLSS